MKPRIRRPGTGRLAQWVGFIALVALLAMATLPLSNPHHDATADDSLRWSWHMARVMRNVSGSVLVIDGAAPARHFWSRWMDRALAPHETTMSNRPAPIPANDIDLDEDEDEPGQKAAGNRTGSCASTRFDYAICNIMETPAFRCWRFSFVALESPCFQGKWDVRQTQLHRIRWWWSAQHNCPAAAGQAVRLHSEFQPAGDQPQAIAELIAGPHAQASATRCCSASPARARPSPWPM